MDKVYNQEGFNVDGFYWRSIGWYGEILEGETEEEATDRLLQRQRAYFVKMYPNAPLQVWQIQMQAQRYEKEVLPTIQNKEEDEEPTESLIELIERCTSWAGYNGLNTFSVVKKTDAENQAFLKKKKELGVIG
jgi:hypothetical protein